ncbi:hypothetical protein TIFTF001_033732 [Ficus carica]|uniref:Uncharacterized protein n=1 Tax=Ficus carica TaxID=3494 RepID=A0AA88DYS3_FICCA|nr:hypothetical protein TIFTF001_033732 [Ficus carica]
MLSMSMVEYKHPWEAGSLYECEAKCLNNCSCTAYDYDIGCSVWTGDLVNLKQLGDGDSDRMTLHLRLAASDYRKLKRSSPKWKHYAILFGIIAAAMLTSCIACFAYYLRRKKLANKRGNRRNINENQAMRSYDSLRCITEFIGSSQFKEDEKKGIPVPFVSLESILAATGNFSEPDKLGQGGFGPVYKGTFQEGQEIAIKRLLSASGQGLQEFKNEVSLIAKLQHRNLVKFLGYCVDGDEKMLLYEHMPNKSLNSFLFGQLL